MSAGWLNETLNLQSVAQLFRLQGTYASIRCLTCQHSARVLLSDGFETMSLAELQSCVSCSRCNGVHGEVTVQNATLLDILQNSGIPTDPAGFKRFAENRLNGLALTRARDETAKAGEVWEDLSEEQKSHRQKLARNQLVTNFRQSIQNGAIAAILAFFGIPALM